MRRLKIGIDIGGTNTDGVLIDQSEKILAYAKTLTTSPVEHGFEQVISKLMVETNYPVDEITAIMVGTTHATNAILEAKNLYKVGLIRIAGHQPDTLPPCFGWDSELIQKIFQGVITINGGYECDGRDITALNLEEAKAAILRLVENGAEAISVVGVFSPLYNAQENQLGEIIKTILGENFPYSLSHKMGGIGIIERENTAILNSALMKSLSNGFKSLYTILAQFNIEAPLYIVKNNGTVMDIDAALEQPISTISSGPTNSFIGGAKLAKYSDAIVIDIGGTSSDCGVVLDSFPRKSINTSRIANIKLNFQMPDFISIALGGGSIIKNENENIMIGPESVARKIFQQAKSFGGNQLTLTDVAIAAGIFNNPKADKINLPEDYIQKIMQIFTRKLEELALSIHMTKGKKLPVIFVGGGAGLIDKNYFNLQCEIPPYFSVANAYGAANAEIAVEYNAIIKLEERQTILSKIKKDLAEELLNKGAISDSIRVIEQIINPFHYMPGHMAKLRVTSAGRLK